MSFITKMVCRVLPISALMVVPFVGWTQSVEPPNLDIPVDPALANQSFEATFSIYTSVGSMGNSWLQSTSATELVFRINLTCGFICPGAKSYREFPVEFPALSPGDYRVSFVSASGDNVVAEFDLAVAIGVSPDKPIAIYPPIPEAYQPFRIEMLVGDSLSPAWRWPVFAQLQGNDIVLEHLADGYDFARGEDSVVAGIQGLPPGDYRVQSVRRDADGALDNEYELYFSVADTPTALPAFTFFHPGINHYFVTAGEDEAEIVRANGWHSADAGFNVWPVDGPAPEAALPVCRFYSELVNSHFYTASASECELLKGDYSGWEYEGIAFQALVPIENACPGGTAPIWRLYNGRASEQDSNHRFVASAETYRTMIPDGWIGEGVAFCSPPAFTE